MKLFGSDHINWTNTLFLVLCPIAAIVGTLLLCLAGTVGWQTWVLTAVLTGITGLSITGGYHRLFSHNTYKGNWIVRLLFILFGAGAFEGSVLDWCTDHRNHHRYTDTDKDPYDINKGFWYAHIGWLFTLDITKRDYSNVDDLAKDPLVRFQHKFYVPLAVFMGFILPTAIASLWGAPLAGLFIAGALRITFNQHVTFFINSLCHYMGERPYSKKQSARDHWLMPFLTYGEGYHNFHHQFPLDYRNGVRWYQFDPTKWLILCLEKLGMATQLKRVSCQRIARYRLQAASIPELALQSDSPKHQAHELLHHTRDHIMSIIERMEHLEKEYANIKKSVCENSKKAISSYRQRIKTCQQNLRHTRRELAQCMSVWSRLVCQYQ